HDHLGLPGRPPCDHGAPARRATRPQVPKRRGRAGGAAGHRTPTPSAPPAAGTHAVFETKADLGDPSPFPLTIRLAQDYGTKHLIGRFRISATSAKRPGKAGGAAAPPSGARAALA